MPSGFFGEASSIIDNPFSIPHHPHLEGPSLAASIPPLPARMCTVAHCHKILPGSYRYKRCEQHRLQNRHHDHTKLKRVRRKKPKAADPDGPSATDDAVQQAPSESSDNVKKASSSRGVRKRKGKDVTPGEASPAAVGVDPIESAASKELPAPMKVRLCHLFINSLHADADLHRLREALNMSARLRDATIFSFLIRDGAHATTAETRNADVGSRCELV